MNNIFIDIHTTLNYILEFEILQFNYELTVWRTIKNWNAKFLILIIFNISAHEVPQSVVNPNKLLKKCGNTFFANFLQKFELPQISNCI